MLSGKVFGADATIGELRAAGARIGVSMTTSIGRLTLMLLRKVKAEKLSGQVLKVRTGRLRRSINQRIEGANTAHVSGVVGTNVRYGRTHELGFKGTVKVKESLRTQVQAWGKPISPIKVHVRAHDRNVDLPERSFLRSSLRELQPAIVKEIGAGVSEAIR
jgi:phage gpG-like protein